MAEEEKDEEEYVPKKKPELDEETERQLKLRERVKKRRPRFSRQEWFRYAKLDKGTWRSPKGLHSSMRQNLKYRPPVANIGYRSPKEVRDLHPSGFEEVLVHNVDELEGLDPKTQAVRIAHGVGMRKRIDIEEKADKLELRILNRS